MSKLEIFDQLQRCFAEGGATAVLEQLIETLRAEREYDLLFQALLMKALYELGLPLPIHRLTELDDERRAQYEEAYAAACREVGELFLQAGDIPNAWRYFRAIGEPQKVRQALEEAVLDSNEKWDALIEIAFREGVHPRKGFEWILEHYGTCAAVTSYGQFPSGAEGRQECGAMLVKHLYQELVSRLKYDIKQMEGKEPSTDRLSELMAGRDWLFEDNNYHVDVSHLSAVVQFSIELEDQEALRLAVELTDYGSRLSKMLQPQGQPPFHDFYRDYGIYLRTICGEDVEAGIEHFYKKVASSNPDEEGTAPAQTLVYLLARLKRFDEAIEVSLTHLRDVPEERLFCPTITQLCLMSKNYKKLMALARERGDLLSFAAALIASKEHLPNEAPPQS